MTKNKGHLQWTPAAERLLLEWVEQNKGPDGPLRQNFDLALDEVAAHLHDQFPTATHLSAITLKRRINDKLRRVWNKYRLTKYQSTPFTATVFFDEGIAALDQGKLGSSMADLFPADEQPQDDAASADNNPSPADQAGTKRKAKRKVDSSIDPVECSSPKRAKSTERDRSATPASSSDDSLNIMTQDVNEPEPEIQIHGVNEPQSEIRTNHVGEPQPEIRTHANAGPTPEVQPNVIEDTATAAQMLFAGSQAHPVAQASISLPVPTGLTTAGGGPLTQDLVPLFCRDHYQSLMTLHDTLVSHPFASEVQQAMDYTSVKISSAVAIYFDRARLALDQPIILDHLQAYPKTLATLLDPIIPRWHRHEFQRLQTRNFVIKWVDFARSLLGQAVTSWCLSSGPVADDFFRDTMENIFQDVHEDYFGPLVAANLREKLWERYIDKHWIPRNRDRAVQMASQALECLDIILPRPIRLLRGKHVSGVRSCRPVDQVPTAEEQGGYGPFHEPPERAMFRDRLTDIFEYALKWRMGVRKNLNIDYVFVFPSFGQTYMAEYLERRAEFLTREEGRVCLGFTPIVTWNMRLEVLGDYIGQRVASTASVLMIEPEEPEEPERPEEPEDQQPSRLAQC